MVMVLEKAMFAAFSFFIALADLKTGRVPRGAFFLAFPAFFILILLQASAYSLPENGAGMLVGLFVFIIAFFVSGKKLGLADLWYSALIGMVLGPLWYHAAIAVACVSGGIFILISRQKKIPFIPFMALGSVSVSIVQGWRP